MTALAAALVVPIDAGAAPQPTSFVFNGEANRLNAYDAVTGEKATIIHAAADTTVDRAREHKDLNAQICFQRLGRKTYFIAGEDTGQGGVGDPGWGWFELQGLETRDVSRITTRQRGKLVPTYFRDDTPDRTEGSNPENYGCGFLDNGALVLSDVGDQQPNDGANGQLHVWFPDADGGFGQGFGYAPGAIADPSDISYCKVDITIPTAGGIAVDGGADRTSAADDTVYVAASRPDLSHPEKGWGILAYEGIGNLTAAACDHRGTPRESVVAAVDQPNPVVTRSVFIQGGVPQMTPSAIVASGNGSWYVSSVFDGSVAEYDAAGTFVRFVVGGPPTGQVTGQLGEPLAVGTPYGLGVAPDGTIWYADIGVLGNEPGRDGRVMKVAPVGPPLPTFATIVDDGLQFPDGIGILSY
jgi:hypothetical protein